MASAAENNVDNEGEDPLNSMIEEAVRNLQRDLRENGGLSSTPAPPTRTEAPMESPSEMEFKGQRYGIGPRQLNIAVGFVIIFTIMYTLAYLLHFLHLSPLPPNKRRRRKRRKRGSRREEEPEERERWELHLLRRLYEALESWEIGQE